MHMGHFIRWTALALCLLGAPVLSAESPEAASPPSFVVIFIDDKVIDIVETMDDQAQLCKRFTDEAVAFIRRNKDKPFSGSIWQNAGGPG